MTGDRAISLLDDEMDDQGFVHLRDIPGLGQDLDFDYIDGNLV